MKITKRCQLDGTINSMEIPTLTPEKLQAGVSACENGALIQNAFPYLTPDEREFLMTGITPEKWNKMFGDGED